MSTGYSPRQFAVFRIVFGCYLALNFALLVPHGPRLFSREGMVPDPALNWTFGYFPSVFYWCDRPQVTQFVLLLLCGLSLCMAAGVARPVAALFLWYGEAALFNRNNYYWSPAMPLIGWLLLATALVPRGEPWCLLGRRRADWYLPRELLWGAWAVLALSYSVSGFFKFAGPSWFDGSAIAQTLQWVWARDWWYPQLLLNGPPWLLKGITWATLLLETFFLPLCLFRSGRVLAWSGMVLLHLYILLLLDLADLTLGVLLAHLFIFDPQWLRRLPAEKS
jgi:hypothetical protein